MKYLIKRIPRCLHRVQKKQIIHSSKLQRADRNVDLALAEYSKLEQNQNLFAKEQI